MEQQQLMAHARQVVNAGMDEEMRSGGVLMVGDEQMQLMGTPNADRRSDSDDVLNWITDVLPSPKGSMAFSVVIISVFTNLVNTALTTSLFGNQISLGVLYIMFFTIVMWNLVFKNAITRLFIDGMLSTSSTSRVAQQDEDWISLLISWVMASTTIIVLSGAFGVMAFHSAAKIIFVIFPVLTLIAIFTSVGIKGDV